MEKWWQPAFERLFGGRRIIIAGAVPPAWLDHVEQLRQAGAGDIMVLATGGKGMRPGPDVPTHIVEPPHDATLLERVRYDTEVLLHPPDDVRAVLDDFDPDHTAIVISGFLNESPTLDGRPVLAWRRPEWVQLEDKTIVDSLWDRAGVPRQPSTVVDLAKAWDAARGARTEPPIDQGSGTVWAMDSSGGFNGGAAGVRWVRTEADARRVGEEFADRCETVRVMPFLEGVACSIHGIVGDLPEFEEHTREAPEHDDSIAVLRPVEMVTLRRGSDLVYAGCATFWDPPDEVRTSMRTAARRVGRVLRDEVGFRGTFTIDGVVRSDGFWPTELNPRFGAGINLLAQTGDVPMLLIHDLVVAGHDIGVSMAELERQLVEHADAQREGGTWRIVGDDLPTMTDRPARFDGERWTWVDPIAPVGDRAAVAEVTTLGRQGRARFVSEQTPTGASVVARSEALWNFLAADTGADVGGFNGT